jgi:hypothetical protein
MERMNNKVRDRKNVMRGLNAGDKLDWSLEARKDESDMLGKKAEPKSGKNRGWLF